MPRLLLAPSILLAFSATAANAATTLSLSIANVTSGSTAPFTVTVSNRVDHTMKVDDMIYIYAKATADAWNDAAPPMTEPMLAFGVVPMTDPADVTITPELPAQVASHLGLAANSAFPDGSYCAIFCVEDSYVKKGAPACWTIGDPNSNQLQEAVDDAVADATEDMISLIGGIIGASAALLGVTLYVMMFKKVGCFAVKAPPLPTRL